MKKKSATETTLIQKVLIVVSVCTVSILMFVIGWLALGVLGVIAADILGRVLAFIF